MKMVKMSHSDEIREAYLFQEDLLKKHQGKVFDELFKGEWFKTAHGPCYKIEESCKLKMKTLDQKKARSHILNDIKLIPGIGNSKERTLKDKGYKNIEDLANHPHFSLKATKFLNNLEKSPNSLNSFISRRYSGSHPHIILASCFVDVDDFLFFDIETLGLKDLPVILIGMARVSGNRVDVKQYLSTELKEEKALLANFLQDVDENTIFVSFNGRSFDLPFIKSRLYNHGIKAAELNHHHLDLLHFSRRMWGDQLPNCRLQTLEKHLLGIKREEDVPSSMVPEFYQKYLKTGNIGPLIPIVEHNRLDVITLAKILSELYKEVDPDN